MSDKAVAAKEKGLNVQRVSTRDKDRMKEKEKRKLMVNMDSSYSILALGVSLAALVILFGCVYASYRMDGQVSQGTAVAAGASFLFGLNGIFYGAAGAFYRREKKKKLGIAGLILGVITAAAVCLLYVWGL